MTKPTYYALLELLIENVSISTIKHPLTPDSTTSNNNNNNTSSSSNYAQFKNPAVIATIFELVCLTAGIELQRQVLQDFRLMIQVPISFF